MAEETGQEKTEAPSPQRLEKAREDGQVLQSRELGTFVVLLVGGAGLWMMASGLGQTLQHIVRDGLQFSPGTARDSAHVMAQLSTQFFEVAGIANNSTCKSPSSGGCPQTGESPYG